METPRARESLTRMIHRAVYHRAHLVAADGDAGMITPLDGWLVEARALRTDREAQRERALIALARRGRRDRAGDRLARRFELDVQGLVERRRDDPRYVRLFHPRTLTLLVRLPPTEAALAMRELADALDEAALEPLRAHQQPLRDTADALDAAQQEFQAALNARGPLAARRTQLQLQLATVLRKNYADLLAANPHDRDEAESFFLTFRRRRRNADNDDEVEVVLDDEGDTDDDDEA